MKSDFSVYEIKSLLKKVEKQNRIKTIVFVGVGIAVIVAVIIMVLSKMDRKSCPVPYDGLDYDDWDDLDDLDYEDYDFDDYDDVDVPEYDTEDVEESFEE